MNYQKQDENNVKQFKSSKENFFKSNLIGVIIFCVWTILALLQMKYFPSFVLDMIVGFIIASIIQLIITGLRKLFRKESKSIELSEEHSKNREYHNDVHSESNYYNNQTTANLNQSISKSNIKKDKSYLIFAVVTVLSFSIIFLLLFTIMKNSNVDTDKSLQKSNEVSTKIEPKADSNLQSVNFENLKQTKNIKVDVFEGEGLTHKVTPQIYASKEFLENGQIYKIELWETGNPWDSGEIYCEVKFYANNELIKIDKSEYSIHFTNKYNLGIDDSTPIIIDLNNDGIKEVVLFEYYPGSSGDIASLVYELDKKFNLLTHTRSGFKFIDLDNNGIYELIDYIYAFPFEAHYCDSFPVIRGYNSSTKQWDRLVGKEFPNYYRNYLDSTNVIAALATIDMMLGNKEVGRNWIARTYGEKYVKVVVDFINEKHLNIYPDKNYCDYSNIYKRYSSFYSFEYAPKVNKLLDFYDKQSISSRKKIYSSHRELFDFLFNEKIQKIRLTFALCAEYYSNNERDDNKKQSILRDVGNFFSEKELQVFAKVFDQILDKIYHDELFSLKDHSEIADVYYLFTDEIMILKGFGTLELNE